MLIPTRKESETIEITTPAGEAITVMVTQINGKQVGLGIKAKPDIEIVRSELVSPAN